MFPAPPPSRDREREKKKSKRKCRECLWWVEINDICNFLFSVFFFSRFHKQKKIHLVTRKCSQGCTGLRTENSEFARWPSKKNWVEGKNVLGGKRKRGFQISKSILFVTYSGLKVHQHGTRNVVLVVSLCVCVCVCLFIFQKKRVRVEHFIGHAW